MIDLNDFQWRVDVYFEHPEEPGGRLILDLMRALREAHTENERLRGLLSKALALKYLPATLADQIEAALADQGKG